MKSWLQRSVSRRVAVLSAAAAAAFATIVGLLVVAVVVRGESAGVQGKLILVALLGGAATVACTALAAWLVTNRLLGRSLRELTDNVNAAARGKFVLRRREERADEIGELARAIDSLGAQITDLSVHVIEGDRELAWTRSELRLKEALSLLFEVSQTIGGQSDLDALCTAIVKTIAPALSLDEMAILLADDDGFEVKAAYGFSPGVDVVGVRFARGEGLTGQVAATGESIVISDTSRDPRYLHYKGKDTADGSFVVAPMKLGVRVVGVFNVLRPRVGAFPPEDVRLLESLASYTALAIAHAQATGRLRELSITDELTGVANRRFLMERLGGEVERARRSGLPLSALMVDLDHFKRINDESGHLRGDEVLRRVAQALRAEVRRADIVARYGGEEFVVLLPDAGKGQAEQVAEKLRLAVAALGEGVTISVGVATLPEDGHDPATLIDAADRALFAAKRGGRNRVASATTLTPATPARA